MPTLPLQRRKGLSTYAVRSSGDNKDPGHEIIYAYQRRERTPPDPRLPRTGLIEPPSAQRLSASTKTRRIARAGSPDDERDDPRRYRRERGPVPSCRWRCRCATRNRLGDFGRGKGWLNESREIHPRDSPTKPCRTQQPQQQYPDHSWEADPENHAQTTKLGM